jgi:tetratricopeptide (TPR) repeat protein
MHDLVRLYAAEQAGRDQPAGARSAALRRVTDFYLHTALAGDRLLAPHRRRAAEPGQPAAGCVPGQLADEQAALAWFAAEHPSLLAAQHLALAQGWPEPAWQLAMALGTFHRRRGHFRDWVASWRAGLTAAEQLGRPALRTTARSLLGFACAHDGRTAEALDHLGRALSLAEQAGDITSQAHIHVFFSVARAGQHDYRQALSHASRAQSLFHAVGDRVREADALNSAGSYYGRLGDLDRARASCAAALALHRRHGFREGEARALDSLGYIAHRAGQHARALGYYGRALALCRDLGDTYRQADTQASLASAHAARGQRDEARDAWQEAIALYLAQHRTTEAARVQQQLDTCR